MISLSGSETFVICLCLSLWSLPVPVLTTSKMLEMKIISGQGLRYGEFIHSLNQFLWSVYSMPGSPPEPENTAVDRAELVPSLSKHFSEKTDNEGSK